MAYNPTEARNNHGEFGTVDVPLKGVAAASAAVTKTPIKVKKQKPKEEEEKPPAKPTVAQDEPAKWKAGSGVYDKLTVNTILNGEQQAKANSRTTEEIAKDLNDRGQAALKDLGVEGGQIESPGAKEQSDPKNDNVVSSAIASEIENELSRSGSTHADNWYTTKVDEAMGIAQKLHPEMENNSSAKFAYTVAMAITSQGETVPSNIRLADKAYETFAKTGKFPTDVTAKKQDSMNGSFEKLNKMIEKVGVASTIKFMGSEFTVGELAKLGHDVSSENVDAHVYGSAILGPKIGQGFYQNLNGNYKPLTTDLWFMRGWGRLTGTLTGTVDVEKPAARLEKALKANGEEIPKDRKELVNRAEKIMQVHEADYRKSGAEYKAGTKKKSEAVYAADRLLQAVSGVKEQPSGGGERAYIRDVFAQAQSKLKAAGHDMSIADMQATWWYPEKRLYSKMGGRSNERINTDYAAALRELADKKGIKL